MSEQDLAEAIANELAVKGRQLRDDMRELIKDGAFERTKAVTELRTPSTPTVGEKTP